MKYRLVRWLIILIFISTLYLSILTIPRIDTQSDLSKIVPDDSNIIDYYNVLLDASNDKLLNELQIVIEHEDFSDVNTRNNILNFLHTLEQHTTFIAQQNWLEPYLHWLDHTVHINSDNISTTDFYDYLQTFANNNPDIIVSNSNDMIEATRFYLFVFGDSNTNTQYQEYEQWNHIMANYSINGYVFQAIYGYSYMSDIIIYLTFQNIFFAALGVLFVLILTTDLRMALFTILIVGSINMHLFGLMYILQFSLDIITYAVLVMSVGLTVDYVIHITVAITQQTQVHEFDEKLKRAMKVMGVSVLKGAFTSLLGGLPLFLSKSEGFRIFGAMWVGIVVIAVLHGFLLVPAVMYEIWIVYNCNCTCACCVRTERQTHKEEIPRKSTTSTNTLGVGKHGTPRPSNLSGGPLQNEVQLETIMSGNEFPADISQSPQVSGMDNTDCDIESKPTSNEQKNDHDTPRASDNTSLQLNEATLAELMDTAEEIISGENVD